MADRLRRGDVVVVSLPGEYGKPRPAVIVQSNLIDQFDSVVVCPLTTSLAGPGPLRPDIEPSDTNGLRRESQVMVDKLTVARSSKLGSRIGTISAAEMEAVSEALRTLLDLTERAS